MRDNKMVILLLVCVFFFSIGIWALNALNSEPVARCQVTRVQNTDARMLRKLRQQAQVELDHARFGSVAGYDSTVAVTSRVFKDFWQQHLRRKTIAAHADSIMGCVEPVRK